MTGIVKMVRLHEGPRGLFFRQRWWWTLQAWNGETLCASELYSGSAARDQTAMAVASQLEVPVEGMQ